MIRVLVVDEVALIADVLATVLREEEDLEVVGCYETAEGVEAHVDDCDVVLLSASLPDGAALELTERISRRKDAPRVLVTGLAGLEAEILRFIEAGAAGYVLREDTAEDLLRNLRAAGRDRALVAPEIALAVMRRLAELAEQRSELVHADAAVEDLTPREREVLRHVARGSTNQQIADALVIELGTVKNHVHSILSKLNVSSRRDAASIQGMLTDIEG